MLLLPLLAKLPGMFGDYFTAKANLAAQEVQTEMQVEIAKAQMATDIAKAQLAVEQVVVASTSARFKDFTFVMWFIPFIACFISPRFSSYIFANLAVLPDWYKESCTIIMFSVWGIAVGGPIINNVFSGLSNVLSDHRDFQLSKAKIDRKSFFDAVRLVKGNLSQSDVDEGNKVLDDLDKQ